MFKVGDILKINMDEFEYQYGGCKGTTVYSELKKAAETTEYEITAVGAGTYTLKRLSDNQVDTKPKAEVEKLLNLKLA